ncbi:fibronectin type III domain-containing protein [Streptomyces sp. GC420]|uniref:fibronectin type III domain-containing protein n=1 Tax=Streptomyces sp. GC420 TaxID=2697568 RepID=UPI0028BD14CD|nr:fibronectin type III domain-containing protein [Streptomyces sp. GC420]
MRRVPGPALLAAALLLSAVPLAACAGDSRDRQPPSAPSGVTVHAGSSASVHVMWNAASDDSGVTGYEVFRNSTKVKEVHAEQHMVDITGLKPSARYTFTVRARDAAGNRSPHSAGVPVTTPSTGSADTEAPTRPSRLRGKAADGTSASLDWKRAKDDTGVASYDVYQGDAKIHSVPGDTTNTVVGGLRPGTDYTFTVRARDRADNLSEPSGAVRLSTPSGPGGPGPGTAPADLQAKSRHASGAYHLDLSWTPPRTGGEVTDYQIHIDGELATTLVWGAKAPRGRAAYSLRLGDEPGTTYRVRLRARLPDGKWGAFSAERTVTTGRAHAH